MFFYSWTFPVADVMNAQRVEAINAQAVQEFTVHKGRQGGARVKHQGGRVFFGLPDGQRHGNAAGREADFFVVGKEDGLRRRSKRRHARYFIAIVTSRGFV